MTTVPEPTEQPDIERPIDLNDTPEPPPERPDEVEPPEPQEPTD